MLRNSRKELWINDSTELPSLLCSFFLPQPTVNRMQHYLVWLHQEALQKIALSGTVKQCVSYLKVVGCLCRLQNRGCGQLCLPSLLLNVLLPASQAGNTHNSFSCGSKRKAQDLTQSASVEASHTLLC